MTSGCRETTYFSRYDREVVLKPAISLKENWGGYRTTTRTSVNVRWPAWWVGSVLLSAALQADWGILCEPFFVRIPHSNISNRLVMWLLPPGNWIAFICLASGLPYAHFAIPTLLRRAKVVHVILDETRSLLRLPQRYYVDNQRRFADRLAHVVRNEIFSVVDKRHQPQRIGKKPSMGRGGVLIW